MMKKIIERRGKQTLDQRVEDGTQMAMEDDFPRENDGLIGGDDDNIYKGVVF